MRSLGKKIASVLSDVGADVASQVSALLETRGVAKSEDDGGEREEHHLSDEEIAALAQQVAAQIDLGGLDAIMDATEEDLEAMALDSSRVALAMLGVTDDQRLVDVVNQRAVAYAKERSAELVGKRVLEDGTIIDNPRAEWAITESTRNMLRDLISSGLEDNIGRDAIIEGMVDDFAFSEERAEMIARTEIAMANSEAAMVAYREAADAGTDVQKEWILGPDPCDICQENADAGPIPLDEDFPSGDDTVPAHPNCVCAVIPVVGDGSSDESGEDDADE